MMIPKTKHVRLHGAALKALNNAIFERDNYRCVICGAHVSNDNKFHHEPCGPNKSDEIDKGVVLCYGCHQERHFGRDCIEVRDKIRAYLKSILLLYK